MSNYYDNPEPDDEATCKNCRREIWWGSVDSRAADEWLSDGDDACGRADDSGRITWDLALSHSPAPEQGRAR